MYNIKVNKEIPLTNKMVLSALKSIKKSNTRRPSSVGICGSVKMFFEDGNVFFTVKDQNILHRLMEDWPKHSGVSEFPICVHGPNPMKEYMACLNMWDQNTKYGQLRWELLEWLINKLESENVPQNAK